MDVANSYQVNKKLSILGTGREIQVSTCLTIGEHRRFVLEVTGCPQLSRGISLFLNYYMCMMEGIAPWRVQGNQRTPV